MHLKYMNIRFYLVSFGKAQVDSTFYRKFFRFLFSSCVFARVKNFSFSLAGFENGDGKRELVDNAT